MAKGAIILLTTVTDDAGRPVLCVLWWCEDVMWVLMLRCKNCASVSLMLGRSLTR